MNKSLKITEASGTDIPDIFSLLEQCLLPTEDISSEKQLFWVIKKDQQIQGTIAIENYSPYGLLRSFAVHPSYRKQAMGTTLLYHTIEQAEKLGIEFLYLLTDTAARYFEAREWIYVRRESVPEKVRLSEQFKSICSESTACMFLPIKDGKVRTAIEKFQSGFNCAQSVFSTFSQAIGLDAKDALKISSGFGAGICYKGEICGAVTGAYMTLGLKYGRWRSEDTEAKEHTYSLMREFDRQFIARNGSLYCSKLLEGDMTSVEGLKKINEQ